MLLLWQLVAVLVAGLFGALAWGVRLTPATAARSIGVFAGALAYLFFWTHAWPIADGYWSHRVAWKRVPPAEAAVAGAALAGVQPGFAEWIRPQLQPGERFYLVFSGAARDEAVYQWFTYRLLPNLSSATPAKADWLIFFGTSPAQSGFRNQVRGTVTQYAPGYSIARALHAG